MDAALATLVAKTASWTVEEMSSELMFLNKVAYSFRHKFDRSLLMKVRAQCCSRQYWRSIAQLGAHSRSLYSRGAGRRRPRGVAQRREQ